MSSTSSTIDQNEQSTVATAIQATTTIDHESTSSSSSIQQIFNSSEAATSTTTSTLTPILSDQTSLTQDDHEDNLMDRIDELIRDFLNRHNQRFPYHNCFRWATFDNEQNINYKVVLKIDMPSSLI